MENTTQNAQERARISAGSGEGKKTDSGRLAITAMLIAMAFVAVLIGRLVPNVAGFLSYDPKDAVVAIGGFLFGPLTAVIVSVIVSFIEMFTISSSGLYGFLMNVVSTCAFALPAAIVYKHMRSMKGALIGLAAGMLCMTAMMLLWNYIITPFYMGVPRSVVASMLVPVFLPFNLIKSGINSGLTLLLYKPLVGALRAAKLVPQSSGKGGFKAGYMLIGVLVLITFVLLFLVMTGVL